MTYRIIGMGRGARIEKKDEEAFNGYREIAKIVPGQDEDINELINELRLYFDRKQELEEIAEENKDLLEKLE